MVTNINYNYINIILFLLSVMKADIPKEIGDWLGTIGIKQQIRYGDIESGKLVGQVLKMIGQGYNLQILQSNSAANRTINWNNIISQLKDMQIKVKQQDKTKIINGNREIIYSILQELQLYYQDKLNESSINIDHITQNTQINKSSSLLQLFILASIQHFNLTSKEAVTILANETKYLSHLLAKGIKGNFTPIEAFILQLKNNINLIVSFCKNKQNQIFFIQAIKPAIISKSQNVSQFALILLDNYLFIIHHKFQILNNYLLPTLILGMRRHPSLTRNIANFIYRNSQSNKNLLANIKANTNEVQYQHMLMEIWAQSKRQDKLQQLLQMKGIKQIVPMILNNIRDPELVLSSLNLLVQICNAQYVLFVGRENTELFMENIQQVIINKQQHILQYIKYLFELLSIFGNSKNQIAPKLLKILLTKYKSTVNEPQSHLFMTNFEEIVREFPTIPYQQVIEALQHRIDHNTINVSQVQLHFLKSLLQKQLDHKQTIMVFNIVSKIFIEQIDRIDRMDVDTCIQIIISIIRNHHHNKQFEDGISKFVKVLLAVHFANIRKHYNNKNDSNKKQELYRLNGHNQIIQNMLLLLVKQEIPTIQQHIQPLICYSIIQINQISKDYSKQLLNILSNLGNKDTILKKYELQIKKMNEQAEKREAKKEKMRKNRSSQSPAKVDKSSSSQANLFDIRKKTNPLSRSQTKITQSAQKGLHKYHQAFLNKLGKAEQQKNKVKQIEGRQQLLKEIFSRKMLQKGIGVKKITQDNFRYIHEFQTKQKQIMQDMVKGKIDLPYYESSNEEERDIRALNYLMKKYQRVLKLYYSVYSGYHRPMTVKLFDTLADQNNLLYSTALWKLLKDHALDEFINVKQVQYLCKRINLKLKKQFIETTALDYDGFEQFILQSSFAMFTRAPKDLRGHPIAQMVQETFSRLKLYASQNRIDEQLFQDPDTVYFNQTQAVRQLNKKLYNNPKYILPQGYKKVVENKIAYSTQLSHKYIKSDYRSVYEVLNQILVQALNINMIQPLTLVQTVTKARPSLYYNQRQQGQLNAQKLSVFLKKEVAKFPIKNRQIAKQSAAVLDDIIIAVQLGHDRVGQKIVNKFKKERMKREEDIRRKEQEQTRKWQERDQELKTAIIKHKKVNEQKKKKEQKLKVQEQQKQQRQKRRKEEEQRELKKKVKEYQLKKQKEEARKREQSEERKRKEKEEFEKKKKEWQQTKMWIQQVKQQRQEEQRKKKEIQEEELKRKKRQYKLKYEDDLKKKQEMLQQYKNKKSQTRNKK